MMFCCAVTCARPFDSQCVLKSVTRSCWSYLVSACTTSVVHVQSDLPIVCQCLPCRFFRIGLLHISLPRSLRRYGLPCPIPPLPWRMRPWAVVHAEDTWRARFRARKGIDCYIIPDELSAPFKRLLGDQAASCRLHSYIVTCTWTPKL